MAYAMMYPETKRGMGSVSLFPNGNNDGRGKKLSQNNESLSAAEAKKRWRLRWHGLMRLIKVGEVKPQSWRLRFLSLRLPAPAMSFATIRFPRGGIIQSAVWAETHVPPHHAFRLKKFKWDIAGLSLAQPLFQRIVDSDRIQARAIRRCGELLKQIEPAQGKRNDLEPRDATDTKLTRTAAATQAGLSERQKVIHRLTDPVKTDKRRSRAPAVPPV